MPAYPNNQPRRLVDAAVRERGELHAGAFPAQTQFGVAHAFARTNARCRPLKLGTSVIAPLVVRARQWIIEAWLSRYSSRSVADEANSAPPR